MDYDWRDWDYDQEEEKEWAACEKQWPREFPIAGLPLEEFSPNEESGG